MFLPLSYGGVLFLPFTCSGELFLALSYGGGLLFLPLCYDTRGSGIMRLLE